jgi:hypothetical protein
MAEERRCQTWQQGKDAKIDHKHNGFINRLVSLPADYKAFRALVDNVLLLK